MVREAGAGGVVELEDVGAGVVVVEAVAGTLI